MKLNISLPRISRQAFYILKSGTFLTIAMVAVTLIYFDAACAKSTDFTLYLRTLGVAREMLLTSVITCIILLCGAILLDIAVKSEKN